MKAIFSGFPTIVFAQIIYDFIIFIINCQVFHVSSNPISKFDLIKKISQVQKISRSLKTMQ